MTLTKPKDAKTRIHKVRCKYLFCSKMKIILAETAWCNDRIMDFHRCEVMEPAIEADERNDDDWWFLLMDQTSFHDSDKLIEASYDNKVDGQLLGGCTTGPNQPNVSTKIINVMETNSFTNFGKKMSDW